MWVTAVISTLGRQQKAKCQSVSHRRSWDPVKSVLDFVDLNPYVSFEAVQYASLLQSLSKKVFTFNRSKC